jgi:hypothetical protein
VEREVEHLVEVAVVDKATRVDADQVAAHDGCRTPQLESVSARISEWCTR